MFAADDLQQKQVPFEWMGKIYVLVEASEQAAVKWRNDGIRAATMNSEGKVIAMTDPASVEPPLVAACLFEAENGEVKLDKAGKPCKAGLDFVNSLPARIVKRMFEWIKENSDLREGDDTEDGILKRISKLQEKLDRVRAAKNFTSSTPATSD